MKPEKTGHKNLISATQKSNKTFSFENNRKHLKINRPKLKAIPEIITAHDPFKKHLYSIRMVHSLSADFVNLKMRFQSIYSMNEKSFVTKDSST